MRGTGLSWRDEDWYSEAISEQRKAKSRSMETILIGIFSSLVASVIYGSATGIWKLIQRNKSLEEQLKDAFAKAVRAYFSHDELQQNRVIGLNTAQYLELLQKELQGKPIDLESEKYKQLYEYFIEEVIKNPTLADYVEIKKLDITQELINQNTLELKDIFVNYAVQIIDQNKIILQNQEKMMKMLSERSNSSSIRSVVETCRKSIKKLKIETAYNLLEQIENDLNNESNHDAILHAAVHCSMGMCARYILSKSKTTHFETAYHLIHEQTITDFDLYERILEGMIYESCKKKHQEEAQKYAEELKAIAPDNYWVYVPDLMVADELNAKYDAIPESVHKFQALTTAVMMGCKAHDYQLGVDLKSYTYQGLTDLTYDNFPIWIFDMSIAMTRFVQQFVVRPKAEELWNKEAKDLYNLTHTYLKLLDRTEMSNLLPDTVFIENLTGYIKDQDPHRLEVMEQEKEKAQFKEFFYLGYAMMLMDANRYPEALELLKSYGEGLLSSILNMRLTIASIMNAEDEMVATIEEAANQKLNLPDHILPNFIRIFDEYFPKVEQYADAMVISNPHSKFLFDQFIKFKRGGEVDIKRLQEEEPNISIYLYSYLSMIYREKIGLDAAIELIKKSINPYEVDIRITLLAKYFKQDKRYAVELYHFLKHQREIGATNILLLQEELICANRAMDYEAVCEITEQLMQSIPNHPRLISMRINALYETGRIGEVIDMKPQVGAMPLEDAASIIRIANVYENIHENQFALDLLYRAILITRDQDVRDAYMVLSLNPYVAKLIYSPKDRVERNDVVTIDDGVAERMVEVESGSVYVDLIGRRVGDRLTIRESEVAHVTIKAIHNKYYGMNREVHASVESQKSKNIKSITIGNIENNPNPLEELHKRIGAPIAVERTYQENLELYHKGEMPMYEFVQGGDVSGMLNLLFDPSFTVYNVSPTTYIDVQKEELEGIPLVLDLSSLIMLSELSRRYGMRWEQKFYIPNSVRMILRHAMANEECGKFNHFHEESQRNMTLEIIDEKQSVLWNLIKSMLNWMDANCEVIVVEEKLFYNYSEKASLLAISEADSVLLAMRGGLLLSEDFGWQEKNANLCPILNVPNWLALKGDEQAEEVFQWMKECGNKLEIC